MQNLRATLLAFVSLAALGACASQPAPELQSEADSLLMGDYLSGRYADMTNDPSAASEHYLNAVNRAPGDPVLLQGAVESALIAGDMHRAVAASDLAKEQGADVPLGKLTQATAALQAGRYGVVRGLIDPTNGSPFDRLAARVLRAWAFAGDGKTDQALSTLGEVGDGAPFARVFDYQRALILQRAGRNDEALGAYGAAIAGGLRIPPALLQEGALLERTGKKDAAIALYRALLTGGDEPSLAAALARAERGEPPTAPETLSASQGASIGLYSLTMLLVGQTDANFYLPYLTLSLALDPTLDAARFTYADGLAETQQWEGSKKALGQIGVTSPFYERAQVTLMFQLRAQDQDDAALVAARAAVEQTHGKLARLALADLLRSMEKWSEAEPLYNSLIKEATDETKEQWRLYFARGACLERLARWPEAEADLKHALKLSPDQPEVLNYLGYSWVDQGTNLQEGMRLIEKAVSIQPDAGYIIDSLGWAHFKMGDYKVAIENLERAVELSPEDPILNDHLGDAYWRGGLRVEARFQWNRSLSLKPTEMDAKTTKVKVAEGLPPLPVKRTARAETRN